MAETGPDQPDNPEDGREDTGPSAQRHAPVVQKIQKTFEAPQEQLWTVPRILKFQETVEYATGPCDSESRRPCMYGTGHGQGLARDGTETGPDRENPEDCRLDTRTDRRVTQKFQKFVEVPRVVQRLSRSPRDPEDREASTTDQARTEGQSRPSEARALRARQDPAWSEAQSGQSPKRPDRPSEVRALVQASVVAGIMACRDELGFHGRSRV